MHALVRDGDKFGVCCVSEEQGASDHPVMPLVADGGRQATIRFSQWKQFVQDGELPGNSVFEAPLLASWRRCRDMNVDPAPRSCWDFLPMDQMEPFASVLRVISGDVENAMSKAIHKKGLLFTITDASGRVARTCGDLATLRKADKLNFGPGANWAEASVGTNAIGTALATGQPTQVFGAEHYCQSHHSWNCTAAPIFDQHGNIWGCFDISGPNESDHTLSMGLVLQAVRGLEHRLCRMYFSELEGRMSSLFSSVFNAVLTGIVSVNRTGHITSTNPSAEVLLGTPGTSLRGLSADHFFDLEPLLAHGKTTELPESVEVTCRARPNLFARATPILSPSGNWYDTVIVVHEPQRVRPRAAAAQLETPAGEPLRGFEHIMHESRVMRDILRKAANVSRTPSTVLLYGESGTGKELFAQGIHKAGPRADGPFVAVNCGTFSEELIQSELFGYCAGAFTGADKRGRIGKFEQAHQGVLFLDEVSEIPFPLQVMLLRALEERAVVPVGGLTPRPVDVKVIAATNRDLQELVAQGRFREDLYYRLNVVTLTIPPLRERDADIMLLAEHHTRRLCREFGVEFLGIHKDAEAIMLAYDWPGNVRELVNCCEYAVNNLADGWVSAEQLPRTLLAKVRAGHSAQRRTGSGFLLKRREAEAIREALDYHSGNMSKAAKALGIGRNTLYAKMQRLHIPQ